jgi:hypothetical protein
VTTAAHHFVPTAATMMMVANVGHVYCLLILWLNFVKLFLTRYNANILIKLFQYIA